MKNKLTVAVLQITPLETIEENMKKGTEQCKEAASLGADIAVFPEMWSIGYDPEKFSDDYAITPDSEFVMTFSKLAKELDMAIAVTYLEKTDGLPKNTVEVFDRYGKSVLRYSKVHTCDFGYEEKLSKGDDFYTAVLKTKSGDVKIGAMICYDREFPESARILMLRGAEVMIVPNACPMEINRLSQLRTRAFENMAAIVTVNYPDNVPDCNGHSSIFDGIAYLPELPCSRDTKIIETDEQEGVFIGTIDIDKLREYRRTEVHGNAYRRPDKYLLLTSSEKDEPFIRSDFRG